jgi:hypothetical protein
MRMNGMGWAITIALAVPILTGCGMSSSTSVGKVAGSPADQTAIAAAFNATGGQAAWQQCRYFEVSGVVAAYPGEGGAYLTEHTFHVSPASHAISISAREPQSNYVWQLIGHQFRQSEGSPDLDVSPLRNDYSDYAEAVLEIMTAPARLQEWNGQLVVAPEVVMIGGRSYQVMKAGTATGLQRRYYQDEASSRVDIVWLANSDNTRHIIVRGYDYASVSGIQIPTKIEVFRSGPARQMGPRVVQIDLRVRP